MPFIVMCLFVKQAVNASRRCSYKSGKEKQNEKGADKFYRVRKIVGWQHCALQTIVP